MRATNTQYLANLATTMIHRLEVPNYFGGVPDGAQHLYEDFGEKIKLKLLEMRPETWGKIAVYGLPYNADVMKGKTALYVVHCGTYCGKHESGRALMVEIACTALVAEMFDILQQSFQDELALEAKYPHHSGSAILTAL